MNDINKIYHNDYGIAFKWSSNTRDTKKIQLVFRNTGLSFTKKQVFAFLDNTTEALSKQSICSNCDDKKSCKSMLLETPIYSLNFAMSYNELEKLKDLLEGAIYQLELNELLKQYNITV